MSQMSQFQICLFFLLNERIIFLLKVKQKILSG